MNAITTHTDNSFLLNNIPFDKHYSFIVEKHFVSNINDKDFATKHITKVSLINHFDGNNKLLSNQLLKDISIDGAVYTSIVDFMNAFDVVKHGTSTTSTPTLATKIPMINENGVLVWQNTMSDGTITYTLQDGTAYAGDVTLLLPYSVGTHKVADFSITTFAVSGAFDYLKTKAEHGFSLIQSIEIGEGQTFNAYANYNILPNGDLVINSSMQFPSTYFVRITGIQ